MFRLAQHVAPFNILPLNVWNMKHWLAQGLEIFACFDSGFDWANVVTLVLGSDTKNEYK